MKKLLWVNRKTVTHATWCSRLRDLHPGLLDKALNLEFRFWIQKKYF